eukprot:gene15584-15395_t
MRWIVRGLIGLVALLILAAGALLVLDLPNQPAKADAKALIARADRYDVQIRRDEWGVPHILGKTNADAAFGLAFAHAEDDFATIQEVTLATRGKLAARNGLKAAPTDYIVSLLGVWKAVDAGYERDLPPDVRAVLEGYADGINLYGAQHPDEVAPGLLPVSGKDIAAGFVFKTPFFYGLDAELKRLNDLPADPMPKGSNGVAVAPSRSADGATRLLVNSHQPFTGAVAWYEAVVESGEGWHVAGGFFLGEVARRFADHDSELPGRALHGLPDRLMDAFPAFFPLEGRRIVIAGTGEAAEAKARLFEGSPAQIVRLEGSQAFLVGAYGGALLAFIAGDDLFIQAAAGAARAAGCLVNVVDRPELCDFNTPAVIDR